MLGLMAGGAATTAAVFAGMKGKPMKPSAPSFMPVMFLTHGSPLLLDDAVWVADLHRWAKNLPRPRAVLMVSAHWEVNPPTLSALEPVPLVYDFSGFPARFYQLQYAAPGAPWLAERIRQLLGKNPVHSSERGLDHGAYIPLMAMYPEADIPILQLSLPTLAPKMLFEIGKQLQPLRQEGVLIIGSGFLSHNLRLANWDHPQADPPSWAKAFDHWNESTLVNRDIHALLNYQTQAPGVSLALPTHEHYAPIFITLGASLQGEPVTFPITGFLMGSLTKRSVQFG
jgi:4,5-DOPA dioxygenase extradiol